MAEGLSLFHSEAFVAEFPFQQLHTAVFLGLAWRDEDPFTCICPFDESPADQWSGLEFSLSRLLENSLPKCCLSEQCLKLELLTLQGFELPRVFCFQTATIVPPSARIRSACWIFRTFFAGECRFCLFVMMFKVFLPAHAGRKTTLTTFALKKRGHGKGVRLSRPNSKSQFTTTPT